MRYRVNHLVTVAMMTALVTVATFIHIPTIGTSGYVNLGDGLILAAASVLGPWAALCGGVGSALADMILGYMQYAPVTLLVKGASGLLAGLLIKKCGQAHFSLRRLLLFIACECVMVAGYFVYEALLFGAGAAALSLAPNALQGAAGVAVGMALTPLLARIGGKRIMS